MLPREKELRDKAIALLHPTGDELRNEMKERGIDIGPFENGPWSGQVRVPIENDSYNKIEIEVDHDRSGYSSSPTGDVCIKIAGVHQYEKNQTYRRRKDGSFNWDKISEKITDVRKALASQKAARKRRAEFKSAENANREAIADLVNSGYYSAIKPSNQPGEYSFAPKLSGLSKAQIVGLAEHIQEWAEANGVEWS